MTQTELVDYVVTKCQLVEDNDRAAAALFLSKRYEAIYDEFLWKDTLVMVDVPFDPTTNLDNAVGIVLLPAQVDRLVALRTANGSVRIQGLEHYYRIDWNSFGGQPAQTATPWQPSEMSILSPIWLSIRSDIGAVTITTDQIPFFDGSTQVKVVWSDSTERYVTTGTLPLTLTPVSGATFVEIEAIFKPVTIGSLQVICGGSTIGTLAPSALQSPSYQRMRVFPTPQKAVTLNVLGKRPCIPLTFPTEVPAIRNLDNCLIAFAIGDMFTRARFPQSEALPYYSEGIQLLKQLAEIETLQAANYSIIEPETGFGTGIITSRIRGFGW